MPTQQRMPAEDSGVNRIDGFKRNAAGVGNWLKDRVFQQIVGNHLVYACCWEDPRVDRQALQIDRDDRLLVITSAGCNVLDYALDFPARIYAVDINPRQNALLELKIAGIRHLDFETFFAFFGEGAIRNARAIYDAHLRSDLSNSARRFWDRHIDWFDVQRGRSFYYRGTAGTFAWLNALYIDHVLRVRPHVDALLDAADVTEQSNIYNTHLRDRFWGGMLRRLSQGDLLLALSGVPRDQRRIVEEQFEGSLAAYLQETAERVIYRQSLADNYFWRVYVQGRFTRTCCPSYLQSEHFARLQAGLFDSISTHTDSVRSFLENFSGKLSKFVLLDHMDWLHQRHRRELQRQWQAIVDRATPGARVIWRSGSPNSDFVDRIQITYDGRRRRLGEILRYDRERAEHLHAQDRCHTYAGFFIADLP